MLRTLLGYSLNSDNKLCEENIIWKQLIYAKHLEYYLTQNESSVNVSWCYYAVYYYFNWGPENLGNFSKVKTVMSYLLHYVLTF